MSRGGGGAIAEHGRQEHEAETQSAMPMPAAMPTRMSRPTRGSRIRPLSSRVHDIENLAAVAADVRLERHVHEPEHRRDSSQLEGDEVVEEVAELRERIEPVARPE